MYNCFALSAETPGVVRDSSGVPVEWTLLRVGDNKFCREGRDGNLRLSAADMAEIIAYHDKKAS